MNYVQSAITEITPADTERLGLTPILTNLPAIPIVAKPITHKGLIFLIIIWPKADTLRVNDLTILDNIYLTKIGMDF